MQRQPTRSLLRRPMVALAAAALTTTAAPLHSGWQQGTRQLHTCTVASTRSTSLFPHGRYAPVLCTVPLASFSRWYATSSSFSSSSTITTTGCGDGETKEKEATTPSESAASNATNVASPTKDGGTANASPAAGGAADGEDDAAAQAALNALAERLKELSEDDQRRILEAIQSPETQKSSVMGGAGIGPKGGDMLATFTCGKCDYRMVKRFSKHAYTKGIVIVECPSCNVRHLLADNLGWFVDEARNIEEILREKGETVTHITGDYQVAPPEEEEGEGGEGEGKGNKSPENTEKK